MTTKGGEIGRVIGDGVLRISVVVDGWRSEGSICSDGICWLKAKSNGVGGHEILPIGGRETPQRLGPTTPGWPWPSRRGGRRGTPGPGRASPAGTDGIPLLRLQMAVAVLMGRAEAPFARERGDWKECENVRAHFRHLVSHGDHLGARRRRRRGRPRAIPGPRRSRTRVRSRATAGTATSSRRAEGVHARGPQRHPARGPRCGARAVGGRRCDAWQRWRSSAVTARASGTLTFTPWSPARRAPASGAAAPTTIGRSAPTGGSGALMA